jgi:hypothetical protein
MRVAENGEPVGRQLQHGVERAAERIHGLVRQAVDEIDVDRFKAQRAQLANGEFRLGAGLNAVDRELDLGIKVLDPDGGAIEARVP